VTKYKSYSHPVTELRLADAFPGVELANFAVPFNTVLVGDRSSSFLDSVKDFSFTAELGPRLKLYHS